MALAMQTKGPWYEERLRRDRDDLVQLREALAKRQAEIDPALQKPVEVEYNERSYRRRCRL